VDYSLFIMVMMMVTLEKIEIPPVAARVEFPPLIFVGYGSIFVFRYFCGALLEEAS
jgi:hypothetical protein